MILCRAFEDSVVCSTGIDPLEKKELQRKVAQLLGEFKGDLASDVTHLVAQEVVKRRTAQPASASNVRCALKAGQACTIVPSLLGTSHQSICPINRMNTTTNSPCIDPNLWNMSLATCRPT